MTGSRWRSKDVSVKFSYNIAKLSKIDPKSNQSDFQVEPI